MDQIIFLTKVRTGAGIKAARLLIGSIRAFGGEMSDCPIWVFEADPKNAPCPELENEMVRIIPLDIPDHLLRYDFGDKVYACASAEELAQAGVQSLVWIDLSCLVVNPPVLYDLGGKLDAAVRPVHIRNVGLLASDPLDAYWKKINETVGVEDIGTTVESFVDMQQIRAYFNTHAFAINPERELLRRWLECFENLVCDQGFKTAPASMSFTRSFCTRQF